MRKKKGIPEPVTEPPRREAEPAVTPYSGPERRRYKRIELD